MDIAQTTFDKLAKIRERTDITIRPTPHLRQEFVALDGQLRPLNLRYYQVQMVLHLLAVPKFVVGDDTGLGKCQPYDSLVLTDHGLLQMGEIEDWSGMEPDSFRSMSRPVHVLVDGERHPIKSFYYGGTKPTRTATTRYGFQNTGSLVHPMLVLREGRHLWVQAKDLVEGDYLCVERRAMPFPEEEPLLPPGPTGMNPALARLIGYYIGAPKYQVSPEIHTDAIRLLHTCFGESPAYLEESVLSLSLDRHQDWLDAIGCGHTLSSEQSVPSCILQATRDSSREFLRALFEGAGHVSKTHIELSTASELLGKQVQIMLLRFGVIARRAPKSVKAYPDDTCWRLTICGEDAVTFQEVLGFISTRKQEALSVCISHPRNTDHNVVPEIQWVYEQVQKDLLSVTNHQDGDRQDCGLQQFGIPFVNTLNNIRSYGRNPSYDFIRTTRDILLENAPDSEALTLLEGFLLTRYFYDPVVELEDGKEEVFDIEVDHPTHCFVGNGFINHNTLESIAALAYLFAKNPDMRVLVLTKKSAVRQWVDEIHRFTTDVKVVVSKGTAKQRSAAYDEFEASSGPKVLVMGHRSIVQDFTRLQDTRWGVFVLDECTVVKNPSAQIHQMCRHVSVNSERVWGLTATLIKNNLLEGFGIYKVVHPPLFPITVNTFMDHYCVTQLVNVGRGRKVKRIVGYKKSDVAAFRLKIEPYYLGRPKHAVAKELPPLVTKRVRVGMSPEQHLKYQEALSGLLTIGDDEKEVTKLTAVTYCQEIVNHLELIGCMGGSEKLDELVELLTEGELAGKKVIVFTRFAKMVGIGIRELEKHNVKCVRITGAEDEDERKEAQDVFQDLKSDVRVVWITNAGSDAINLQSAEAVVCYDTPFAAGDYLQVLGRMIRLGSIYDRVVAIHLLVEDSVDEKTMDLMEKKMGLVEAVLGKRLKGEGDEDNEVLQVDNGINDLFNALRDEARGLINV